LVNTLSQEYFDSIYDEADDPWSFASSSYEDEKYTRSLAYLQARYDRALEIGCSIGVFTHRLAERCRSLFAVDISPAALDRARVRCADDANVTLMHAAFPHEAPPGRFDLVTCCEVGYYWSDLDLAAARDRLAQTLVQGGDLLLVHFLPHVEDYVREGDAVHEAFLADTRFEWIGGYRAERYRIDLLRRR
jgi:SAM-dependent methyltransferase